MQSVIYDKLKNIKESELVSFHMPGHKYGRIYDELGYTDKLNSLFSLDTTEIIETDNLHNAKGIIKKSQELARDVLFGDIESDDLELHYLVNGSTCGIEAAIMAVCKSNDKIIMNRGCHLSAFNSCLISSLFPVFVKERIDRRDNIFLGASVDDYIKKIEENKDARAVYITRPTYYGMSFDISSIVEHAHKYGMAVIVDEAHGAHFGLNEKFPKSALYYGADIVVQSIHKTLPSMTQTSVLLVQNSIVDRSRLKKTLPMFESSSPSYIMMASLEIAFDIYEKYGRRLMDRLLNNIYIFKREVKRYRIHDTDDMTKIFINTIDKGICGYDFEKILRYKYNIQVELSNYSGILMLCTIGNDKSDFDRMLSALRDILDKKLFGINVLNEEELFEEDINEIKSISNSKKINLWFPREIPEMVKTPREAFDMETEQISIDRSLNRICAEFVTPYPPGVCVISPGERINMDIVEFLTLARSLNVEINGVEGLKFNSIRVIKE